MEIKDCVTFEDYTEIGRKVANKVGFLTDCFTRLHSKAPAEDLDNIGGRMAALWRTCNRDTGYLLKLIWDSCSVGIAGSHLNYIQGMIRQTKYQTFKPKLEGHAGMEVVK